MANKVLGHCNCPLCGFEHQEIRESSNGKPYIICDECGMQMFARQARSVRILRERIAANPAKPEPVKVEPTNPAPVQAKPAPEKPKPKEVPTIKPEELRAKEEETTLFDVLFGKTAGAKV